MAGAIHALTARRIALASTSVLVFALCVAPLSASLQPDTDSSRGFEDHVAVLSVNALIGAATAGVAAALSGREFAPAFVRGALGGMVHFAGKRIAVADWGAAPLVGRVVASTGTAVVRQASLNGSVLDSVRLPIGPLRVDLSWSDTFRPRLGVSAFDLVLLAQAFAHDELYLDWSLTASALTPVFLTRSGLIGSGGARVNGLTMGRMIVLDGVTPGATESFAHETVHVLQNDFMEMAWDRPFEDWARRSVSSIRFIPASVSFNVLVPLAQELDDALFDRNGVIRRLMQSEAQWFER